MKINFKMSVRNIAAPPGFPPDVMRGIGRDLARQIRQRTKSGRDVNGIAFKPKADGSPSNLRDSGKMIASLRARRFWSRGFEISPSRKFQDLAARHQFGKGKYPKREWIGLSEQQINEAAERIKAAYLRKEN